MQEEVLLKVKLALMALVILMHNVLPLHSALKIIVKVAVLVGCWVHCDGPVRPFAVGRLKHRIILHVTRALRHAITHAARGEVDRRRGRGRNRDFGAAAGERAVRAAAGSEYRAAPSRPRLVGLATAACGVFAATRIPLALARRRCNRNRRD